MSFSEANASPGINVCLAAPLKAQDAQRVGDSKYDEIKSVTLIMTSAILFTFLLLLIRTSCALWVRIRYEFKT